MTSLYEIGHDNKEIYTNNSFNDINTSHVVNKSRNVLKSKRKTKKIIYNKELKRKLKKYKLKHNGKEDSDVVDVSNFLTKSLVITSPNTKENFQSNIKGREYIPKNYLFKMGRRLIKNAETISVHNTKCKEANEKKIVVENDSLLTDKDLKKTNAFQLLMDSRNKVIGANSPGKERSFEQDDTSKLEKKDLKTKRVLILQKMAEAKGSSKKLEMEEYTDKSIKQKMDKRAEKLKNMLLNNEIKTKKSANTCKKMDKMKKNSEIDEVNTSTEVVTESQKMIKENNVMKVSTLQLVNIFNECEMQMNISPKKKQILKEDEDFLKKLSPSLKKKENMLSYFKKIEKEPEIATERSDRDDLVIKVKLKGRKNKNKTKKLSLKKNMECSNDLPLTIDNNILNVESKSSLPKNFNLHVQKENQTLLVTESIITNGTVTINADRPKRSIKRPVKYTEDPYISSSDECDHIFTPKKKKNNTVNKTKESYEETEELPLSKEKSKRTLSDKVKEKVIQKSENKTKLVKLAPIFAAKVQPTLAEIEAKQKFLQSGVPEQLKKKNHKQKSIHSVSISFPVTVHIQQNNEMSSDIKGSVPYVLIDEISSENGILQQFDGLFPSLIDISKVQSIETNTNQPTQDINNVLKNIKKLNQKFPVYRMYSVLKDKKRGELKENPYLELDDSVEIMNNFSESSSENPDQLNWTSKYKPTSSKQIIGNFESIKELRKWLVQWTENEAKNKNNKDDSDFSDFYHSDTDSRGSMKVTNNLIIITGPVGCGKTSGVYAVASELAFKVLEVNASSKRTGKIMLQDLHEATQSHKVNRGTGENSQKSQDVIQPSVKNKKRGRPKKLKEKIKKCVENTEIVSGTSQEINRTAMSLILIDDADIVFEQDDGFCSAIIQLVQCSKRPVILITSTLSCPHLQRFLQIGKILRMKPLLPRMLGTWLDILCLVNNGSCCPGLGAKCLDYFRGDMRKTINYLQFYTQSDSSNDEVLLSQDMNGHVDEEKSNMSWVDQDTVDNDINSDSNQICSLYTGNMFDLLKCRHSIPLFNIWWSVPKLLNSEQSFTFVDNCIDNKDKETDLKQNLRDLESLSRTIDAISISDMFEVKKADTCITSLPWHAAESNSVSENDNIENYARAYELSEVISYEYVKGNILHVMKSKCSRSFNEVMLEFPGMRIQREKDRIASRHNNLNNCLTPSAVLDKRALALDYWSSCRSICRVERTKTDNNLKRNNRFCHYLKSINANCNTNYLDNLADSLCFKEN